MAKTIILVLVLYLPDHGPITYEDHNIGTLGACIAVVTSYLNKAIETPRSTKATYQASCIVKTALAEDAGK